MASTPRPHETVVVRRGVSVLAAVAMAVVLVPVSSATPAAVADCTIVGTSGSDELRGTDGPDVICGGNGDDRLIGGGGDDEIRGGAGNDVIRGGDGDDRLRGDAGDDWLRGGAGNDTLRGADDDAFLDLLRCGPGTDKAFADMPDDVAPNCENVVQNDAPTNVTLAPSSVAENQPSGTVVGQLSAVDPDPGDTHTFKLVTGPGSADNGSFAIDGDGLETAASLDFEADDQLSIRVRAIDAEGATDTKSLTVTVTDESENPPVAVDDAYTTDEDTQLALPVSGAGGPAENDTDADGDTLTVAAVSGDTGGTATIVGGEVRFVPAVDECSLPATGFDYTISDGQGETDTGHVAVTVTCVDDAPEAEDDHATVTEDDPAATIDVLANDTDAEGDSVTISAASDPADGTVVLTGGSPGTHTGITYQPDPNYCNDPGAPGDDTFTYTVDGGDTATVSVTVSCVDDLPVAVDDSATVSEDDSATEIDVLANDTDIDAGPLEIDSVTQPTDGTVVITGGGTGVTYEPDADFCNDPPGSSTDDFSYTLNGGDSAAVTVTVTCVNDAPVAVDNSLTVDEDAAATAIDVLGNDTDTEGDAITITSASNPADGTVVLTGGSPGAHTGLTYEPDPDYCNDPGTPDKDTFTYTINGGDTATVSATVTCIDDAPVAVDDTATVTEDDDATAVDVLANDTDVDAGQMLIESVTQPLFGSVVMTGGGNGLTYEPDADFCSVPPGFSGDDFTYTLNGGATATVSMAVTCVDDEPVAVDDSTTALQDSAPAAIDVLANDLDIDAGPISVELVTQPDHGTVVITGGGAGLTFEPDAGFCDDITPDEFDYALNGGSTATVSVTVACDVPPTAVNDTHTVDEDAAATTIDVLANDTDPDSGPISVDAVTQPGNGAVIITNGGEDLTYEPEPDYCNDGVVTDDFTYTLAPGGDTASVNVTVTCVDDAPAAFNDSATVLEDATTTAVDVLANDTDNDAGLMRITSASDPANGTVDLTGGSPGAHTGLTYQPDPNYCNDPGAPEDDTFTYTLNGGSTATVSVTVTCVPDAPTIDNSAGDTSYTENAAATVVDGNTAITNIDSLTITAGSVDISTGFGAGQDALDWTDNNLGDAITEGASTNKTILLTGDGTAAEYESALEAVTFVNSSDDPSTTTRVATYSITSSAGSPSDTKNVTVTAVDDAPTAVNDASAVLEDAAATAVDVLANDTDVDAGPKTIASASDPANGTVVLTGGSPGARAGLTYLPDPNYCNNPPGTTPDTFTYTLNGGSTATVSVAVTCVNDAPVADDETFNGASSAVGNTALVVNDPDDAAPALSAPKKSISGDILAGDTDVDGPGPLTVTPGTFTTNDGGSVDVEADGDFTYRPAAGTSCTDTSDFFDYTVSDNGAPVEAATGRVTIAITGCVWYVSNNAGGNSGTSTAPFDTLAQAESASTTGNTVFVFDGDNTSTGYAAGFSLKANQVLTSEAADLVIGSETLWTGIAGNRPTLTDNNADVVDLDDATTVRGFVIDPQGTGGGIAGTTGDTGGGTIDNVSITDGGTRGTQPGLELDATTGTFNVSDLTINNGDANNATANDIGVRLNNAGTVVFAPGSAISVSTQSARALDLSGTALGTSTFDEITVTSSGSGGLSLVNTTGTIALGDESVADISLTTDSATAAFLLNNAGAVTVGPTGTDSIFATNGPAVDITGPVSGQLGSFVFDDTDSTNSATDGINLDNFGTATFATGSGSAITGATGIGFDLNLGNANVTYDGTITTSGAGARPVEVTSRTGGTVDFNGLINGTSAGVNLNNNTGATVRFDGGTTLSTGGNAAFAATGGGTVVVTDPNATGTAPDNTITTTTGTALNVTSTSIGADGITFRSIASGSAGTGPTSGIILNGTGSSGGLTITGNGGTCTSAATCSGGAIQFSSGAGIVLTNVGGGVSLTRVAVTAGTDDGIRGSNVNGLSLANAVVLNNGNAVGERGLDLFDLTGSGGIASSTISGSSEANVRIENNTAVALTAFSVTGTTISNTSMVTGDDGLLVLNDGAGSMTVSVTGSTFTDNKGDHFQAASDADASGAIDATFDNNTLTTTAANDPNVIGGGITINTSGTLDIDFHVGNNNIQQAFDDAINLNLDPGSQPGATFVGTVTGNTIGTAGVVDSGSESSNTVTFGAKGAGTATVAITNNTIKQWSNAYGIFVGATEGSPVVNATVTGNNVKQPGSFGLNGIRVDAGATSGPPPDASILCVVLTGNDATGTGVAAEDIRLRQRFNTTIKLPGYAGANNDTTAVNNFVSANNTGAPTVSSVINVPGGGGFIGGPACTLPPQ